MRSLVLVVALAVAVALGACRSRKQEVTRSADPWRELLPKKEKPARAPAPRTIPSALPEVGPHPDYPTPVAAGTDKIFYLEEPSRGPRVTAVVLPDERTLTWENRAHCELDPAGIVCSTAKPLGAGRPVWRVGSVGGSVVVAQRLGRTRPQETFHFRWSPEGKPLQIARFDGYKVLDWVRSFDLRQSRFSERRLNGGNSLLGCGQMAYKLAAPNRAAEVACLQWQGEPMRDINGVRVSRLLRDSQKFVGEEVRLGNKGEPMTDNDGVHRRRLRRDAQGRVLEESYLDIEGKPILSARIGCHGLRFERDARGLVRRRSCVGADGKPALGQSGASIEAFTTNAEGCTVEVRHLGLDGKPTTTALGVHAIRYAVDDRCQETMRACLDVALRPQACGPREPARYEQTRDSRGRVVSTKHYAVHAAPGVDPTYGVFEVRFRHDQYGNITHESCYGSEGEAVLCGRTGFHEARYVWDDAGRNSEERFYDTRGAPTTNLGCVIRRHRHDNYDHLYEARDYDGQGRPIESMGKAVFRKLYDQSHRQFAVILLGKEGRPARYLGCFTGVQCPSQAWHAVRIDRSPNGRVLTNRFFDEKGQLIYTMDCSSNRCWS